MTLPDVEAIVVAFLRDKTGARVGTRVPNPRPERFIRAWRSGGSARNRVLDAAHVTVTAWAGSSLESSDLARQARTALLGDYTGMPLVRGVDEIGGLYYDPDPATGAHRHTFTVRLMVRAHR